MGSGFTLVSGGGSPVTLDEFKEFATITHDEDDRSIENILLPAASEHLERLTGRALLTQVVDAYQDTLSRKIVLPRSRASSITYIKYHDENNVLTEIDPANYTHSYGREPSIVQFDEDFTLPVIRKRADCVNIRYEAGRPLAEVGSNLKLGVMLLATHAYEHKGLVTYGASIAEIPRTLELFIETLRIRSLGRI